MISMQSWLTFPLEPVPFMKSIFQWKCVCVSLLEKPCDRKPCVNAKKCINVGNSYRCICKDGWKGTNCEKGKDH